jgi:hypothetical protein
VLLLGAVRVLLAAYCGVQSCVLEQQRHYC